MATTRGWKEVEFTFETVPGLRVCLAGSFNKWDALRDQMREDAAGGRYTMVVPLPPGRHEYRFVVGEQWYTDPKNPDTVANGHGSLNSVMTVE